eukprot:12888330-Prorocentrum_lima.AAC.1
MLMRVWSKDDSSNAVPPASGEYLGQAIKQRSISSSSIGKGGKVYCIQGKQSRCQGSGGHMDMADGIQSQGN